MDCVNAAMALAVEHAKLRRYKMTDIKKVLKRRYDLALTMYRHYDKFYRENKQHSTYKRLRRDYSLEVTQLDAICVEAFGVFCEQLEVVS